MAKLYPPIIGGTIPAFYSEGGATKIVVPFSMNKAVGKTEVYGFSLKLKYVDGSIIDTFQVFNENVVIQDSEAFNIINNASYDLEKSLVITFDVSSIRSKYLKIGQYYKVQLAYIDEDLQIGYYSTVGVIKYTVRPTVIIDKIDRSKVNNHQYAYTGVYSQYKGDPTEKVYSSRFVLTYNDGTIIEDTGYVLHNCSEDDLSYESRENFLYARDLKENNIYYLTYMVKTMNGLECSSPRYRLTQSRSIGAEIDISLSATLDYENGYIKLGLICNDQFIRNENVTEENFIENKYYILNNETNTYILANSYIDGKIYYSKVSNAVISGTFLISRACSKDDFEWSEIKRFDVQSMIPGEWSLLDCTLEQGYTYRYSLQQYNANDIYSNRIVSPDVYVDFEHAYLYDGNKQFKISYDPKITNFKNNLLENKVDTIGNKYPFILRNGNVNYKSFDIQGLISLRSDEEGLFMSKDSYEWDEVESDLTSKNITSERLFKRAVQDWLNNGNPKLFRSPTEGNFIVRLLNVSLTPNDKLGRMIHSFKATAYEIEEFNIKNLEKFNIIDSTENLSTLTRWTTIDLKQFSKDNSNREWVSINNSRTMYSIKIQDCMPGTIVEIDGKKIMIGATGTYIAESIDGFNNILIRPADFIGDENNTNYIYSYPIITYSYQTKAVSVFGTIEKVEIEDIPLHQFIGTSTPTNILATLNDTQSTVSSLGLIRFKKKDVYQVFIDCENPENFDPTLNYKYYEDEGLKKEINLDNFSKVAIYQIRCKRSDYEYYNQEGYYIDKNINTFAPFTNYFIDGKTKEIYQITPNLFKVILNEKEEIDLTELLKYVVQDVKAVSSILLNQGVIAEISYSKQISTYHFDNNSHNDNLSSAIKTYNNIKNNFQSLLESKIDKIGVMSESEKITYLQDLDNTTQNIKNKYNLIISELDQAIHEYKEQNGLQ